MLHLFDTDLTAWIAAGLDEFARYLGFYARLEELYGP